MRPTSLGKRSTSTAGWAKSKVRRLALGPRKWRRHGEGRPPFSSLQRSFREYLLRSSGRIGRSGGVHIEEPGVCGVPGRITISVPVIGRSASRRRSEERRVGKECRARGGREDEKKKKRR